LDQFDYFFSIDSEALFRTFLKAKVKELGIFLSYYYKKEGAVAEKSRITRKKRSNV